MNRSNRTSLLVAAALAFSLTASWIGWNSGYLFAQNPESYIVRLYPAGSLATYQVFTFSATEVSCNVTPYLGPLPATDPRKLEWVDRVNVGMVCVWEHFYKVFPAPGIYDVTLTTVTLGLTSSESIRAPFIVTKAPDADVPLGLKVYR